MCTSLIIRDVNGHAYHGRTLEFSVFMPISVNYFPVGTIIESSTPDGKQGLTFNTKYAILGMMAGVIPNANWTVIEMSKLVNTTQIKSAPIAVASQTGAMEFNQFYG